MDIGEQLQGNFPNTIRKDKPVFSAIISNSKKTGAIESVLRDIEKYGNEYSRINDVYNQYDELLDQTVNFISYFERFTDESDEALKLRLGAIFKRKGDLIWGNPFDVKNVFQEYFPSARIYIVENVNSADENYIINGDFQEADGWVFSNPDIRTKDARFSKGYGISVDSESDFVKQEISLDANLINYTVKKNETYKDIAKLMYGNELLYEYISNYEDNPSSISEGDIIKIPSRNVYFLHFFLKGNCQVIIKDTSNNKYWNYQTKNWQITEFKNSFKSKTTDWTAESLWILNDFTVENIEITIMGDTGGWIDFVRMYQKKEYPSFSIIAQFEGNSTDLALALADGEADLDPITENLPEGETIPAKYGNYGYFGGDRNAYDGAYLSGVASGFAQDVYEDLLQYVIASGVKAYIEIVNRDEN